MRPSNEYRNGTKLLNVRVSMGLRYFRLTRVEAPSRGNLPNSGGLLAGIEDSKVSPGAGILPGTATNSAVPTKLPSLGPIARLAERLAHPIPLPQKDDESDNWDDDFEGVIPIAKLHR